MIIVHINPAGVEKVFFQSPNDLFEDLCLAAWPLVRHELASFCRKTHDFFGFNSSTSKKMLSFQGRTSCHRR